MGLILEAKGAERLNPEGMAAVVTIRRRRTRSSLIFTLHSGVSLEAFLLRHLHAAFDRA